MIRTWCMVWIDKKALLSSRTAELKQKLTFPYETSSQSILFVASAAYMSYSHISLAGHIS